MLELSQAELARLVGCAEVTIRKIEADERRPSPQIAERLAQSLELAPAERVTLPRRRAPNWRRSGCPSRPRAQRPLPRAALCPGRTLP